MRPRATSDVVTLPIRTAPEQSVRSDSRCAFRRRRRGSSRLEPLRLEPKGVAELATYREELRAEIGRVEAEMARQQSHLSAADTLFHRP